jgi:hypothetical protein
MHARKEGRPVRQREKEASRNRIFGNLVHRWTILAMLGLGFWSPIVMVFNPFLYYKNKLHKVD